MVDNVLWIITDDQMRWTLSKMPEDAEAARGQGRGVQSGLCRGAVVRAGACLDSDEPLPARSRLLHKCDAPAICRPGP